MTETMRGCAGPEPPVEACAPCPVPREILNPDASEEPTPSADQEMQWASSREDNPLQGLSLNSQIFLSPPPGLGTDPFQSPALRPGGDVPCETCEDMCRDLAELPCEAGGISGTLEDPCKGRCRGTPYEPLYEGLRKVPACRIFDEEQCGELWLGTVRLPSIVVEPSEGGDVESGELRWPPDEALLLEETEEDELFAEGLSPFESDAEEVLP